LEKINAKKMEPLQRLLTPYTKKIQLLHPVAFLHFTVIIIIINNNNAAAADTTVAAAATTTNSADGKIIPNLQA